MMKFENDSLVLENGVLTPKIQPDGSVGIFGTEEEREHIKRSVTSIMIPDGATKIGICAFLGCSMVSNVHIPESVREIEYGAFWDCSSLGRVYLPDSVEHIGDYAFCNCTALTDIRVPDHITQVDATTFENCRQLENIHAAEQVRKEILAKPQEQAPQTEVSQRPNRRRHHR